MIIMKKIKLPSFLQPCLASYDLKQLDVKKDKILIITSILNKGDYKALKWLGEVYDKKEVENVVKNPVRGFWYEWILRYWLKILDIKLPNEIYQKAIIKL